MSNENKTALTADEILLNDSLDSPKQSYTSEIIVRTMEKYASLQTQEKDKEIAELKERNETLELELEKTKKSSKEWCDKAMEKHSYNRKLQSTIESQQKEIEGISEINRKFIDDAIITATHELKSQLDSVTKERDELREGLEFMRLNFKDIKRHDVDMGYYIKYIETLLNQTKEERKEGECEHIAVLIDNKPVYCCSKCDKIIDN